MLAFYIENDLKLRHLRQCPIGRHLDGFADWLRVAGYKQRPAQQTLRGAAHLGHWDRHTVFPPNGSMMR